MDAEAKYQDIMMDSDSESSYQMNPRNFPIQQLKHLTADGEEIEKPKPNPRGLLPLCLPEIARLKGQPIKTNPNSYMSILPPPDIVCHSVPPRIDGLEFHHTHNPLNNDFQPPSPRSPHSIASPQGSTSSTRNFSPVRSPARARTVDWGARVPTSRSTPILSGHRAGIYSVSQRTNRGVVSRGMSHASPSRRSCQSIPLRYSVSQTSPFDMVEELWVPKDRFDNTKFLGSRLTGYVNTGKLGQGPARYDVGVTVAGKCIPSTKSNVPKYSFGNTARWDYTAETKDTHRKPVQLRASLA